MPQAARSISCSVALALGAAGIGLTVAAPASAATAWPAHVVAPYVDAGLSNTTLTSVASSTGDKFFTLAFVDGANCSWSMYNTSSWQTQIANLRAAGGDVSVSFGGWTTDNGGTDLGNTCSSAAAAATQMENVVTTFDLTHIDFDIEAVALSNHTDVDRTNQALALVRSWAAGAGRSLSISYTLPTFPTGLSSDGQYVLSSGRSAGFTPNVVNVMAMDYGTSGTEMGTAANQALDADASQVASTYGKSLAQGYAMLGMTPMIGQNDSAGEIFTLSDASLVESHAAAEGIAELSFWSEGRDNGGCVGSTTASSICSGVSQGTGAFTSAFEPFAGGSTSSGSYPTGYHQLVVQNSKLCADVAGAGVSNGAAIDQWTCKTSGQANQEFQFNPVSGGYGELQNQNSGSDIAVFGASTAAGASVIQYTQNGTANSLWQPIALSDGTWQFKNQKSGLCLDMTGNSTSANTQFEQWTCKSSAVGSNQAFATQ
ncbi:RICIN domain-containing protein [Streptacidiphilus sp. EB103A]|uniref:RICIN domain-containing protein n=1 Tax=Streptacidiphilus sp. EB103A TaxID=3156275 RepID=UPI0035168F7F